MNRESEKYKTRSCSKNGEVLRGGGELGKGDEKNIPNNSIPPLLKNYLQQGGKINHIRSLFDSTKLGWMLLLKLSFKFIVRDMLN